MDLPALKTVRPKWVLTTEQAAALLRALPPLKRTMVGLALLSGLRRGELFALQWKDIDADGKCLSVRQAVYDGKFDTPKTQAGRRTIPMSEPALKLVEEWRQRTKKIDAEALVFSTRSGTPLSPNHMLRRSIFPACDALGLRRPTWLTFLRTYSSWSHDHGVPGKVVAQLMGHANVNTTLNVYTQVFDDSLRSRLFTRRRNRERFAWPASRSSRTVLAGVAKAGAPCPPSLFPPSHATADGRATAR